jgi:hypothetical protein
MKTPAVAVWPGQTGERTDTHGDFNTERHIV